MFKSGCVYRVHEKTAYEHLAMVVFTTSGNGHFLKALSSQDVTCLVNFFIKVYSLENGKLQIVILVVYF